MFQVNLFYFFVSLFSSILSISSTSWIMIWLGLEINSMSFMPLLYSKDKVVTEMMMKLFFLQSMSSSVLLFFSVFSSVEGGAYLLLENSIFSMLMMCALLFKLGVAPFHYWLPGVVQGMSWFSLFLFISWQKFAPLLLMMNFFMNSFMVLVIILNLFLGVISGFGQTSLSKLIGFSSIHHMGWMLSILLVTEEGFLEYFVIYVLSMFPLFYVFHCLLLYSLSDMMLGKMSFSFKMCLSFNLLSVAGLPPLLGFVMKLMIFSDMKFELLLSISMVLSSLLALFFYSRLVYGFFTVEEGLDSNFFFSELYLIWPALVHPLLFMLYFYIF